MTSSRPLARALCWIGAVLGATGAAIVLSGPLCLLLRGIDPAADMGHVFRRLLEVLLLGVVLLGLHPWRDAPPGAWGLYGPAARPRDVFGGVALAFALLFLVAFGQGLAGWVTWDRAQGLYKLSVRWPAAVAGGAALGVVEELFFRGWLLGLLAARMPIKKAVFVGALVYALPHAFSPTVARAGVPLPASPSGALEALGAWLRHAIDPVAFGPSFVGLVLLGVALSAAYLRTGSLWLGIGIHAGAHVFLTAYSALTDRAPERNWAGSKWLYDGPPAWLGMALLCWALWPRSGVPGGGRPDSETSP